MSLVEKDDIREYDPRLWEKLKAKNLIIREKAEQRAQRVKVTACLLYTSPSPRDS